MKSKIENKEDLMSKIVSFEKGAIIFWTFSDIKITKVGNDLTIPPIEDIKELRVFNEDKELFVWRMRDELFYREKDDTTNTLEFEESKAVVRGSIATKVSKIFSHLKDIEKIAILKRDYIDYNEIGAAGYVDSRFVKFIPF